MSCGEEDHDMIKVVDHLNDFDCLIVNKAKQEARDPFVYLADWLINIQNDHVYSH